MQTFACVFVSVKTQALTSTRILFANEALFGDKWAVFFCVALLSHAFLFTWNDLEGGIFVKKRFRKVTAVLIAIVMTMLMIPMTAMSVNASQKDDMLSYFNGL